MLKNLFGKKPHEKHAYYKKIGAEKWEEEYDKHYETMKKTSTNILAEGNIEKFLTQIEVARDKGFITERQYKKHLRYLDLVSKSAMAPTHVKNAIKDAWERLKTAGSKQG